MNKWKKIPTAELFKRRMRSNRRHNVQIITGSPVTPKYANPVKPRIDDIESDRVGNFRAKSLY